MAASSLPEDALWFGATTFGAGFLLFASGLLATLVAHDDAHTLRLVASIALCAGIIGYAPALLGALVAFPTQESAAQATIEPPPPVSARRRTLAVLAGLAWPALALAVGVAGWFRAHLAVDNPTAERVRIAVAGEERVLEPGETHVVKVFPGACRIVVHDARGNETDDTGDLEGGWCYLYGVGGVGRYAFRSARYGKPWAPFDIVDDRADLAGPGFLRYHADVPYGEPVPEEIKVRKGTYRAQRRWVERLGRSR
jgi:hypothetical protein